MYCLHLSVILSKATEIQLPSLLLFFVTVAYTPHLHCLECLLLVHFFFIWLVCVLRKSFAWHGPFLYPMLPSHRKDGVGDQSFHLRPAVLLSSALQDLRDEPMSPSTQGKRFLSLEFLSAFQNNPTQPLVSLCDLTSSAQLTLVSPITSPFSVLPS